MFTFTPSTGGLLFKLKALSCDDNIGQQTVQLHAAAMEIHPQANDASVDLQLIAVFSSTGPGRDGHCQWHDYHSELHTESPPWCSTQFEHQNAVQTDTLSPAAA